MSSAQRVETLSTRGLLFGTDYALGDHYRGIWGLYANYDYLAPQIFHVSTTSLSLGTTAQWWAAKDIALQGTVLAGLGYSAASTARGVSRQPRLPLRHRLAWLAGAARHRRHPRGRSTSRPRVVSVGRLTRCPAGRDDISRIDAAFTWRLRGPHAIGIHYVWSHRSASFPNADGRRQSLGKVGLYYALLGQQSFGAVDWRNHTTE